MKKILLSFLIGSTLLNCQTEPVTTFSDAALNDEFITLDESVVPFSTILEKHKGETIFIDVWASWCKDCLKSLPKLKELQKDYHNTTYVFLSLDKSINAWKKGIQKHELKGDHYYMQSRKPPYNFYKKSTWRIGYCRNRASRFTSCRPEVGDEKQ